MCAAIVRIDLYNKLYCTVVFEGHIVLVPWLMYSAVLCGEHQRFCSSAAEYTQMSSQIGFPFYNEGAKIPVP